MPTTAKRPNASAYTPNSRRFGFFVSVLERATEHFSKRPHHVNAVRQGKARPIHERQFAENLALLSQGYNKDEIIAGLETMIIEIEESSGDSVPFASLGDVYQSALEAESAAAPYQNLATVRGDIVSLDRGIEFAMREITAEKRHVRAMIPRRDTLRLMVRQVGPIVRSQS